MPELLIYEAGWRDKRWTKSIDKLSASQRQRIEQSLVDLAEALAGCTHPQLDLSLNRWSPTRYRVPGRNKAAGDWYEYRLGDAKNRARVIICHNPEDNLIYLVARTVIHDHRRLHAVIKGFAG